MARAKYTFQDIMNILRYEGLVTMEGIPTRQPEGRQYLGYVPELPALYPLLTVRNILNSVLVSMA